MVKLVVYSMNLGLVFLLEVFVCVFGIDSGKDYIRCVLWIFLFWLLGNSYV